MMRSSQKAQEGHQNGRETARSQKIDQYAYLVPCTLKRLSRAPDRYHEDMLSAGYVALVKAVDTYDPDRGVQFESYAITKIRGAMLEELRREDWTPRSERDRQKRGEPALILQPVSLETILYEGDTEDVTLLSRISDWEDTPDRLVPEKLEREVIHTLVRCLPKTERKVILLYYWQDLPYREIAGRMSLSESRVHQLAQRAEFFLKRELAHVIAAP
jgi:RNA polymerase sigma factor FliA